MLRYVIALFLLNMYSRSLGAPADMPPATNSLTDALSALAKNCGNPFISTQIESVIQNCSQAAVDKKSLFECLIFYDINSQLCYAINNSKLVITEDVSAKVNQKQNVTDLCNAAKDWQFTRRYNLGVNLTTMFQDPATCIKLCGVADVLSIDSIFFCKYFNWGWEKLRMLSKNTSSESAQNVETQPNVVGTGEASNLNHISSKTPDLNANLPSPIEVKKETTENKDNIISNKNIPNQNLSDVSNVEESPSVNPDTTKLPTKSSGAQTSNAGPATSEKDSLNGSQIVANELTSAVGEKTTSDGKTTTTGKQNSKEGNPKFSEDIGDDNIDGGIDGEEDDGMDDIIPPQTFINNNKDIRISGESFSAKAYMDEAPEEDHFFPFFLTAIILVVLLYVLYHNKGKVTKVFLGLIVEGRQNGRRRNSRGHAYRRLDTLEQAMSGNLAAQPSKIIY